MMWMCLLSLTVLLSGNEAKTGDLPICDDSVWKCPPFELISRNDNYEVRKYPEIRWLRTKFQSNASPNSKAFWKARADQARPRIFDYFKKGKNVEGKNITMQRPVFTQVCNQTEPKPCDGEHYLHVYLPDDEPSPDPTDDLVEIYTSLPATYFVKPLRGAWAERINDHRDNLKALVDALSEAGESWEEDYHYYATYMPKPENGYEEDWLKKPSPSDVGIDEF